MKERSLVEGIDECATRPQFASLVASLLVELMISRGLTKWSYDPASTDTDQDVQVEISVNEKGHPYITLTRSNLQ